MKRTLVFTNPTYLSTKNEQLIASFPGSCKNSISIPIEDIGYIILENQQITITNRLLSKLAQNKALAISCDNFHLPCAMVTPFVGHTQQSQRIRFQIGSSLPLKKQLWKHTIISKIENQYDHLKLINKYPHRLKELSEAVTSGDKTNCEAIAAAYYFKNLFSNPSFKRSRHGSPPNNLLNYGYAILRGITARALSSTGLLLSLGIKHQNKYNPFCLADDIMEPYRPFVDSIVLSIVGSGTKINVLSPKIKGKLVKISSLDVSINNKKSPLMTAMSITSNSVYECFTKRRKKIIYPKFSM